MYFLRAKTRPESSNKRFDLLHDQRSSFDHYNASQEDNQLNKHLPKCDQADEIKIDTECWIKSYCCPSQSPYDKHFERYRLSRFSLFGHKLFSKASLRKRLAGVTCFRYKNHSSNFDESLKRSAVRQISSNGTYRGNIYTSEVIRDKSDPKVELRVNIKSASYSDSDDLSPTSTFSEDGELRPAPPMKKKKKRVRKVTRYYNTDVDNIRNPRTTVYYSSHMGRSNRYQGGKRRGLTTDKSAVGRHLEWLKFIA